MDSKYEMKDEGEMESEPGGLITWVKVLKPQLFQHANLLKA